MLKIRKTRTKAYHPARNVQGENASKSIKRPLIAKVKSDPKHGTSTLGLV